MAGPLALYLDQNYLSGMAKGKPAYTELAPVLRRAVDAGAVTVAESVWHERESRPRPDLGLLALLRSLSGGRRLPAPGAASREARRRMTWVIGHELPERRARPGDVADVEALAAALPQCDLITCDAFMADVIGRARLDVRFACQLFTGRRPDVLALRDRLAAAVSSAPPACRPDRCSPARS